MNQRIKQLRAISQAAQTTISHERASLLTDFYANANLKDSIPLQRARAFEYVLTHKKLYIEKNELIVGERGPSPKAVPTYPEICLHSLQDLEMLDSRPKVSYKVSEETKTIYREKIIPFWTGKSHRERLFNTVSEEWKQAYYSGVFTEFQEQRAPGHTVLGDKIYKKGMLDLISECTHAIELLPKALSGNDKKRYDQLKAMIIAAGTLITYARRHGERLNELAELETDLNRKVELSKMAQICYQVPANPPENFHEALQYYWFVHLGVITELNPWDSFNPGRLDQHLWPFYQKDLRDGKLTKESAVELLQNFWIKFNNHPAPPKTGVTAKESNTYTDFALINLGGLTPDGNDAVNDLSYILLDVIEEMRLLQPSSMVQISKKNPDTFIDRTLEITATGFGQPSYFNTDAIIQELLEQGKSIVDARNGGCSGCVEVGAFGKESYFLTGYFNLAKVLEITLNNGVDPLSGKQLGLQTGNPESFETFEMLQKAYELQLNHFIDIKLRGNRQIEELFATYLPVPFLSLLIDDCIETGIDYNAGGARYNTSYVQGVGLGSLTDSLASIKYNVYDSKNVSWIEMLAALQEDFIGFESLQDKFINHSPKYGNDHDLADEHSKFIFKTFYSAVNGKPTYRGGTFHINFLPTTSHVYFGSKIGAMPDGRKAYQPLSEGISPVQGADRNGPTAVLRSASKIDHIKTGGTLLNQKFTPDIMNSELGREKIRGLIRAYFRMNGHHIQFNVVTAETLKKAQKEPEKYKDLIVRVAGYSDYFNDLEQELQDEIIRRTEHYTRNF